MSERSLTSIREDLTECYSKEDLVGEFGFQDRGIVTSKSGK